MLKKAVITVSILTTFLSVNGCRQGDGAQNIIKGIDVQTSVIDGNTFISLDAIVKMGELQLPKMEVPIKQPDTSLDIGTLTMEGLQDGTNRVAINLNYTKVSRADPHLGTTLPNGRELPGAIVIGGSTIIGIPILENSRIYVGGELDSSGNPVHELIVGAAIGIAALDNIVGQLPFPLNIFIGFPFSPEVYGVGGMYTSAEKGKSGVAIFAKKAPVAPAPTPAPFARSLASENARMTEATEFNKLDTLTKFRLNRLLNTRKTLKVK